MQLIANFSDDDMDQCNEQVPSTLKEVANELATDVKMSWTFCEAYYCAESSF